MYVCLYCFKLNSFFLFCSKIVLYECVWLKWLRNIVGKDRIDIHYFNSNFDLSHPFFIHPFINLFRYHNTDEPYCTVMDKYDCAALELTPKVTTVMCHMTLEL